MEEGSESKYTVTFEHERGASFVYAKPTRLARVIFVSGKGLTRWKQFWRFMNLWYLLLVVGMVAGSFAGIFVSDWAISAGIIEKASLWTLSPLIIGIFAPLVPVEWWYRSRVAKATPELRTILGPKYATLSFERIASSIDDVRRGKTFLLLPEGTTQF